MSDQDTEEPHTPAGSQHRNPISLNAGETVLMHQLKLIATNRLAVILLIILLIVACIQGISLVAIYSLLHRGEFRNEILPDVESRKTTELTVDNKRRNSPSLAEEPLNEFARIRNEMNQLLDDSFLRFQSLSGFENDRLNELELSGKTTTIQDNEDHYVISMALPSLKTGSLNITLDDMTLIVEGRCRVVEGGSRVMQDNDDDDEERTLSERSETLSRFHYSFPLPEDIDESRMTHTYENGFLEIEIPKQTYN